MVRSPVRSSRPFWTLLVLLVLVALGIYKLAHNPEWRNFDFHKLLTTIRDIQIPELLGGILLMYLTYYLRGFRWYEFLRPVKKASIRRLCLAQILGFGAVAILGRAGELTRPYLIAKQEDTPVSSQMAVWILERFYDFVGMIVVVGGGFVLSGVGSDDTATSPIVIAMRRAGLSLLIVTVVGVVLLIMYERRMKGREPALRFLPERYAAQVRRGLASFAQGLGAVRSTRAQILGALYSLGIWVSIAAAYWMVLQAFGPPLDDLNFASSMLVMGFSIAGSAIQAPGVGGGSQVLGILALTEIYGVPTEMATSAGIVLWMLAFLSVVPLAMVIAFKQGISLRSIRTMVSSDKVQESHP